MNMHLNRCLLNRIRAAGFSAIFLEEDSHYTPYGQMKGKMQGRVCVKVGTLDCLEKGPGPGAGEQQSQ